VKHQPDGALAELLLQSVGPHTASRLYRELAHHAASIGSLEDAATLAATGSATASLRAGTMGDVTDHADRIEKLSERVAAAKEFL
jgi:hypothetical protein